MFAQFDTPEPLAKREISHHVEAEPVTPVLHVFRFGPARRRIDFGSQRINPRRNVFDNKILVTLDGRVRECLVDHSSPERVAFLVDLGMKAERLRTGVDGLVPVRLSHIGPSTAVDGFQGSSGVVR